MLLSDLFRISFHNLQLHKIRSFLTSLGIIFGVGSVISMMAISEGAKREALAQIKAMGVDKIIVYTKEPSAMEKDETSSESKSLFSSFGLTEKDLRHIRTFSNVHKMVCLRDARKRVLKGTSRLDVKLAATDFDFLKDSNSEISLGRWFSPSDFKNSRHVCVLGVNAKRKLFSFGAGKAVDSIIDVEGTALRVIGILENNMGTEFPGLNSPNDMILIPMSTSNALYKGNAMQWEGRNLKISHVEFDLFIVSVDNIDYINNTSRRIERYLKKAHHKSSDWGVLVPLDLLKQKEQTQNIFTIVMSSIAGISLIVGGVGIMNITLANVYERRKEIGTRIALGAKKRDILMQFLVETVFLTSAGGGLGVCLGIGISKAITYWANWPTVFSLWSILLSLIISWLVGVLFGTYPAWKAAQQNPIEVLRAE